MTDDEFSFDKSLDEGLWNSILSEDQLSNEIVDQNVISDKSSQPKSPNIQNDWDFVRKLLADDKLVECKVTDFNRGGLLVKHLDPNNPLTNPHLLNTAIIESDNVSGDLLEDYLGRELTVKVIECTPDRERIVLSERAAQTNSGERNRLFSSLDINSEYEGKVTNVTNFGLFVDLGGIEGLVHISELSWKRVDEPKKLFNIGQKVKVKILEIGKEKGRVSLSIKRLVPNPWENISNQYPMGKSLKGTVIEIVKFGVFVKLEDGLEGLIHISEMKLNDGDQIKDILAVGEQILVELISVDVKRQRMSLRLVD